MFKDYNCGFSDLCEIMDRSWVLRPNLFLYVKPIDRDETGQRALAGKVKCLL